jgi:hypothetical protein
LSPGIAGFEGVGDAGSPTAGEDDFTAAPVDDSWEPLQADRPRRTKTLIRPFIGTSIDSLKVGGVTRFEEG